MNDLAGYEFSASYINGQEIEYPRPIRTGIPVLWRGAIRYVFELTRAPGKIEREQHDEPGGKLLFEVSWA